MYRLSLLGRLPGPMASPRSVGKGIRPDTVRAHAGDAGRADGGVLPIDGSSWRSHRRDL